MTAVCSHISPNEKIASPSVLQRHNFFHKAWGEGISSTADVCKTPCRGSSWSSLFPSIKSRPFWSHTVEPITMTIKRMMGEERGRNRGGGMCVHVCVVLGVGG